MKISYVTTFNALDVQSWSGAGYYISKALKDQNSEIDYVGNLLVKSNKIFKVKELFYRVKGLQYLRNRELSVVKNFADQVSKRMSRSSDIVFSPGTVPIAFLDTKKPKVFYTDATFAGMIDFYGTFTNLCSESIKSGHAIEQAALSSCSLAIYSSDWAAKTAIDNYKFDPEKVKIVPFGANIESNRTFEDIKEILNKRSKTICRLLFLGVDWERKGGDVAINIVKSLNKAGLKSELHIAGKKSFALNELPENVINHGFISKSSEEGINKYEKLIAESHFLVLPSKAEASALVFCEANALGVPNIATNVGGASTIIKDNINGKLFPLSATELEYSNYIFRLFTNYNEYEELALSSFNEYQERLNWDVSGKRLFELIQGLK